MTGDAVVGLMALRDEWPLCALSVSHALEHHVDTLWVADHEGGDEARAGLAELQGLWADRLKVVRLDGTAFWQEAMTAVLLELCGARPRDWIYVLDADEFAITGPGRTLRTILGALPDETSVVRYQVENWISERDFDEHALDAYRRLVHSTVPNVFVADGLEMVEEEVLAGHVNYFDVPFHSKIVFRRGTGAWVAGGAHALKGLAGLPEVALDREQLRIVHLPLLTRARLAARAARGADLVTDGLPREHGWQSQMVHRIADDGGLDGFWARHSMPPDGGPEGASCPTVRRDGALVDALEPTLRRLATRFGARLDLGREAEGASRPAPVPAVLPVTTAVAMAHALQCIGDELADAHRRLSADPERLATERERLVMDRDWLLRERARLEDEVAVALSERDGLSAELTDVAAERDRFAALADSTAAERDRAVADLHTTRSSVSWRVARLPSVAARWARRRWAQ